MLLALEIAGLIDQLIECLDNLELAKVSDQANRTAFNADPGLTGESGWSRTTKNWVERLAIACVVVGLGLAVLSTAQSAAVTLVSGIALFILTQLENVSVLEIWGLKARMREQVADAESTLKRLAELEQEALRMRQHAKEAIREQYEPREVWLPPSWPAVLNIYDVHVERMTYSEVSKPFLDGRISSWKSQVVAVLTSDALRVFDDIQAVMGEEFNLGNPLTWLWNLEADAPPNHVALFELWRTNEALRLREPPGWQDKVHWLRDNLDAMEHLVMAVREQVRPGLELTFNKQEIRADLIEATEFAQSEGHKCLRRAFNKPVPEGIAW